MNRAAAVVLAASLAVVSVAGHAKDLGVRGATWPVAEPDLLAQIEARLREMERSGELARLEDEARANARRKLEEPDPVSGIAPGIVPPGHFYLHADHADSHDSRYAEIGLVPRERILGRAIVMPDIPWLGLNGPLVGPEDAAPAPECATILPHAHDGPPPARKPAPDAIRGPGQAPVEAAR